MFKINKQKVFIILLFVLLTILPCCKRSKSVLDKNNNFGAVINKDSLIANVTIFVHGTYIKPLTMIFKPFIYVPNHIVSVNSLGKMHYIRNIAKTLSINNSNFSLENFYAYGWSGKLDPKERENAAKVLYFEIKKLIEKYKKSGVEPKITIITHSHGGNVALNLSKFKEKDYFHIDRLILLAVPVQEMTSNFIKDDIFNKIYSFSSSLDLLQIGDPQGLYDMSKDNKNSPLFSKRFFKLQPNLRQAKIKINDRAIFHIEFIMKRFIKHIPDLIKKTDSLDESLYLVKLNCGKDIKVVKLSS